MSRFEPAAHRRVRAALQSLSAKHVEILSLAYGVTLRSRDYDDHGKRKAVKAGERNWRVLLVELYGRSEPAIALASPKAQWMYQRHVEALGQDAEDALPTVEERCERVRAVYGLSTVEDPDAPLRATMPAVAQEALERATKAKAGGLIAWLLGPGRPYAHAIDLDARAILGEAIDGFAAAYGFEAPKRTRNVERTRTRILASHHEHGQEIGG